MEKSILKPARHAGWFLLAGLPLTMVWGVGQAAPDALRDGLSPREAQAAFTLPEGFRIVQSAAEPGVVQPVAMTLDDRGRVWVVEGINYPNRMKGDVGKDRILIFEDKDGDGVFDSRKVFTEGLNLASGIEIGFGGVWVGAAPYLMFIPDRNGDDVPDGEPEVLLDGFGWQDTHEVLNSFIWGPDGWLYGCHGIFTHSRVGKPGMPDNQRVPVNAAVWRYHPVKKEFEVFAQGTSNPWGVDFNDHGQAFITACVIPHLYHVIQGGRYQRQAGQHFDPFTYDDIKTCADHRHYRGDIWANSRDGSSSDLGGGHAHCGLSIYLGDDFPEEYRGKLLFNNLHGHRINQEMVERSGSGFVGKHQPDFVFSNDRQHMGVTLRYGPDGGLYLSDWYDSQTCHNPKDEVWNRTNGRIYKITHGKPVPRPVDLGKMGDLELAGLQLHRNEWFVRQSRKILQQRAAAASLDPAAIQYLKEVMTGHAEDARRLRAMWTLHAAGVMDQAALLGMTRDAGEYVRGWAVQLLCEGKLPGKDALVRLADLAKSDTSQMVRLYLAACLQRLPLKDRWQIAGELVSHPGDATDQNLPLMLWYGVSDLVPLDSGRSLELAKASRIPTVRQYIVRRLSGTKEGREAVLAFARENGSDRELLSGILTGLSMALAKERDLEQPSGWTEVEPLFAALDGGNSRKELEVVSTAFGDEKAKARLLRTLEDTKAKAVDRSGALAGLVRLRVGDLPDQLIKLAGNAEDPQRDEWIQALGDNRNEKTVGFIMGIYQKLNGHEKGIACQALASTREGAEAIAGGLESSLVHRQDLSAFAARQMRSYGSPRVAQALEKHWGSVSSPAAGQKAEEMNRWRRHLTLEPLAKADQVKGKAVFQSTCFACHALFDEGAKIGPDLTGSNRRNLEYLLENIIDPNGVIGLDYQLHIIEKKDGQQVTGLLKEKNASHVSLAMPGGATTDIATGDIKRHEIATTSMMPEGLLANLTEEQVRDLIAYLQSGERAGERSK